MVLESFRKCLNRIFVEIQIANFYLFIYFTDSSAKLSNSCNKRYILHADGKARPTGTYSFPDKLSLKTNTYSLQTTAIF